MALIVRKSGSGNFISIGFPSHLIIGTGLIAGEALTKGDPLYVKNSDGKVYISQAVNGLAESDAVRFFSASDFAAGETISVFEGPITIGYSDGTAGKGKSVYLSATKWRLADAPVYAGQSALGYVLGDGYKIRLFSATSNRKIRTGTTTLVAGTKAVADTSITANSIILLTSNVDGGSPGWLRVSARTAGTSFTITSSNNADTSTVGYMIIEP